MIAAIGALQLLQNIQHIAGKPGINILTSGTEWSGSGHIQKSFMLLLKDSAFILVSYYYFVAYKIFSAA